MEHNVLNSRLYQLPDELVLNIMSHTRSSGIALFRLTCSRFYNIIDHDARSLCYNDRCFFKRMIFRDRFYRNCEFERGLTESLGSKNEFLCAPCRFHHPKSDFLPEELFKTSETRSCIGAPGVLRICAHLEFTHATLRAEMLEQYERNGSFKLVCTHPDHDPYRALQRWSNAPTLTRFYDGLEKDWYWITLHREILKVPRQQSVSRLMIANLVKELDGFLCPHLRIDDAAIIDLMTALNTRVHNRTNGRGVFCKPATIFCVTPNCFTSFLLYRDRQDFYLPINWRNDPNDYDSVMVRVFRHLGTLLDAVDPSWCSQIVTL